MNEIDCEQILVELLREPKRYINNSDNELSRAEVIEKSTFIKDVGIDSTNYIITLYHVRNLIKTMKEHKMDKRVIIGWSMRTGSEIITIGNHKGESIDISLEPLRELMKNTVDNYQDKKGIYLEYQLRILEHTYYDTPFDLILDTYVRMLEEHIKLLHS